MRMRPLLLAVLSLCCLTLSNQVQANYYGGNYGMPFQGGACGTPCGTPCSTPCAEPCFQTECCPGFTMSLAATIGYGRIELGDEALLQSVLIDPILFQLLNTHNTTGGFAWRVYGNGFFALNCWASLGAEVGFSHYAKATQTQRFQIPLDDDEDEFFIFERNISSRAYGVDILLDLVFHPCSLFMFSVKPGFQLAKQCNRVSLLVDPDSGDPGFLFDTNASYRNVRFLPEIILSLDAKALTPCIRGCRWITTLGVSYQHVFGHEFHTPVVWRIASRDMVGLNIGFVF